MEGEQGWVLEEKGQERWAQGDGGTGLLGPSSPTGEPDTSLPKGRNLSPSVTPAGVKPHWRVEAGLCKGS